MRNVFLPGADPRGLLQDAWQNPVTSQQPAPQSQGFTQPQQQPGWFGRTFSKDNTALSTGLIQGGLAMLASNGPGGGSFSQALARGLGGGLNAYSQVQAQQQAEQQRMGLVGNLLRQVDQMDLPDSAKNRLRTIAQTGDMNLFYEQLDSIRESMAPKTTALNVNERLVDERTGRVLLDAIPDDADPVIREGPNGELVAISFGENGPSIVELMGAGPPQQDLQFATDGSGNSYIWDKTSGQILRRFDREVDERDMTEEFNQAARLRGDFNGDARVTAYMQVRPGMRSVLRNINELTAAADIDFVFAVAKAFDPTSVVREGEQLTVRNTQGLNEEILGAIRKLQGGNAIGSEGRRALLSTLRNRVLGIEEDFNTAKAEYEERADYYNLRPQDIVTYLNPVVTSGSSGLGANGARPNGNSEYDNILDDMGIPR